MAAKSAKVWDHSCPGALARTADRTADRQQDFFHAFPPDTAARLPEGLPSGLCVDRLVQLERRIRAPADRPRSLEDQLLSRGLYEYRRSGISGDALRPANLAPLRFARSSCPAGCVPV